MGTLSCVDLAAANINSSSRGIVEVVVYFTYAVVVVIAAARLKAVVVEVIV